MNHYMASAACPAERDTDELFLEEVGSWLEQSIAETEHPVLQEAAAHLCLRGCGGKRIRPRLVWAFAGCLERSATRASLREVAVAAELLHSGSLLHDDVIDRGLLRRGQPTANVRWGNTVAVLAGDMMLVQALGRLRELPAQVTISAVETMASMIDAVTREVEARGNLELSPRHWRRIAEGKTGALFGWCGKAVGLLAGDREAAAALERCGRGLGVAFQLADDLADLLSERSGKTRFSDLKNRELSYPILLAAATSVEDRAAITALWSCAEPSQEQVYQVGQQLTSGRALDQTASRISRELEDALQALGCYRGSPGGTVIENWAKTLTWKLIEPKNGVGQQ